MVDRCKRAHHPQRQRQLPWVPGERNQQGRAAHAEEIDEHHRAPAPEISQPPRGQGPDAEHDERTGGVGHEIFPAADAEFARDRRHCGRENQQHQVIDRVGEVQQQRCDAQAHFGFWRREGASLTRNGGIVAVPGIARETGQTSYSPLTRCLRPCNNSPLADELALVWRVKDTTRAARVRGPGIQVR